MTKVFANVGLSLDGYIRPSGCAPVRPAQASPPSPPSQEAMNNFRPISLPVLVSLTKLKSDAIEAAEEIRAMPPLAQGESAADRARGAASLLSCMSVFAGYSSNKAMAKIDWFDMVRGSEYAGK